MTKRYPQNIMMSCETPWDENYQFMETVFRKQVRSAIDKGFNHIYIFGTAGEGYAVTNQQFKEVVSVFRDETNDPSISPNICIIAMSTHQAIERIEIAHKEGFRIFQITLPSWGVLNDEEYIKYVSEVCNQFPDSKFFHYNLPRAKRVLLGPEYKILEESIPNLVGTKNLRTDILDIHSIATHTKELQHFWGEYAFPLGCIYGESSLLSSFGSLFPTKTKEFFELGTTKNFEKLFPLLKEMIDMQLLFEQPGLEKPEVIDGAWDKMIVRASGIDMPLRLLPPYKGFDEKTFDTTVQLLKKHYPDWLQ